MEASPAADDGSDLELDAEREGKPFLLFEADGEPRVFALETGSPIRLGRGPNVDLDLGSDTEISRVHADVRHDGGRWGILDDEQSRNGSFVNERRVRGFQALEDGDSLRLGRTELRFRDPARQPDPESSEPSPAEAASAGFSDGDRALLLALCSPLADAREGAEPADVPAVAAAVGRDEDEVRTELEALARRLSAGSLDLAGRETLAERALRGGLVRARDLETA